MGIIERKIFEYIRNTSWKKSLMLSGGWGVGKTTTINNFFIRYKEDLLKIGYTHYCKINAYQINNEFDIKKYIVKNSYSIENNSLNSIFTKTIINNIKKPNIVLNGVMKIAQSTLKNSKTDFKITGAGISLDHYKVFSDFYENNMENIYNSSNFKQCIIVIDEVDRQIFNNLTIIFTNMIDLLEKYNLKIVFIINSEEINDKENIIELWYEKIFDFKVSMENERFENLVPQYFSNSLKSYIRENKKIFNNYRLYNKYKIFSDILENKYKQHESNIYISEIITYYKESIYYNIFLSDRPNNFNDIEKNDKKKANLLLYAKHDSTLDFLNLNYENLFTKIDQDIKLSNRYIEIMKKSNSYKKSFNVCHKKGSVNALENPLNFINSVISDYCNILDITLTNYYVYTFYYWIDLALQESNNKEYQDKMINFLNEKIEEYYKKTIKNKIESLQTIKIIENISDNLHRYFYGKSTFYIQQIKEKNDKIILNIKNNILFKDIRITDIDELLILYLKEYPKTFEEIVEKSDDYVNDLKKLKELNDYHYNEQKKLFIKRYKESERCIKDYIFEII